MGVAFKEDLQMYESNTKYIYFNYPYLLNRGRLEFKNIYKIATEITIKGKYKEEKGEVDFLVVKMDNKYYYLYIPNQIISFFINY